MCGVFLYSIAVCGAHGAKAAAIGVSVLVLTAFSFKLNAHERFGQGVTVEDRSITNRLELWKATPAMMVDAPGGWGIGNSGNAFMRWYQPTQRTERYRTLVNSHLTWLVEIGWPLRFLYVFAWGAVCMLCLPTTEVRWYAVPLGIWFSFGVAAFFSSVAENVWLWIIPWLSLAAVLLNRLGTMRWPRPLAWGVPVCLASLFCVCVWFAGHRRTEISGSKDLVVVDKNAPLVWLVVDERILGGHGYAKSLREHFAENPNDEGVGVVQSLASLPVNLSGKTVVVAGSPEGRNQEKIQELASMASRLILLSPSYYPHEIGKIIETTNAIEVFFGEFSQSPFLAAWEQTGKVRRIAGVGDFFPNWISIVFGEPKP